MNSRLMEYSVQEIKGLQLLGASNAMIVAITSVDPQLNIFKLQEAIKVKGWDWNTILYPSGYVIKV
jgi:hypothetical protein